MRQRCHALVRYAREQVQALTGLPPLTPDDPAWFSQMSALPLPPCDLDALKRRLYDEYRVEIPTIDWNGRSERSLPRSRYEAVIHRVLKQRPLKVQGRSYKAERMRGWYEIVFCEQETGQRRVFNLDELAAFIRSREK